MRAIVVLLVVMANVGVRGQTAEAKPAPKTADSVSYKAYARTSLLRADMVHPEKFLVEHVQVVDADTCVVYRSGEIRAAVSYYSDTQYHVVAPEDCFKPGRDVTDNVKRLLGKETLPTDYSISELTGRFAYHWADQIRRYEAMAYGDESDNAAAEAVADELKREMDEHEAFLTGKGDKQIMVMLDTAMSFASIHRSKVNVAFLTHQSHIPTNIATSIPCTFRIQAAAKAFAVPASLSADCELQDDTQEKPDEKPTP
jgi:hypothetical protein